MTDLSLILDCANPEGLADFWSEALHYQKLGWFEPYFVLTPGDGSGPNLALQRVPEPKAGKNRMHFDLTNIADIEGEAKRLQDLGGRRLDAGVDSEHGICWIRMADPEGNEFCVCDGGGGAGC